MITLTDIRGFELEVIAARLPAAGRILEIGGGSGYQAHLLAQRGYDVVALDVASRPEPEVEYHPVATFDGRNLPFADDDFDAVVSSNVLEHVSDLPRLLAESRRVLKPGAVAVHTMPTATWRFWTSLAHYPYVIHHVGRRLRTRPAPVADPSSGAAPISAAHRSGLRWYLAAGPHGEGSSELQELLTFRAQHWRDRLEECGFAVEESEGCGLFYTGQVIFPGLSLESRRRLAQVLGSSCRLYLLRA